MAASDGQTLLIRDGRELAKFPTGTGPTLGAETPNGDLYVSNNHDGSVSIISGRSAVTTLPLQSFSLQSDNRGRVYGFDPNGYFVLDGQTTLAQVSVEGGWLQDLAVGPGGLVYLLRNNPPSLIEMRGSVVLTTVPLRGDPYSVLVDPSGRAFITYQVTEDAQTVTVVKAGRVVANAQAGVAPQEMIFKEPNTVYVLNHGTFLDERGSLTKIVDGVSQSTFQIGCKAHGLAVGDDGTAFVTCPDDQKVMVIRNSTVAQTLHVDGVPGGIAVSPDGFVYVLDSQRLDVLCLHA